MWGGLLIIVPEQPGQGPTAGRTGVGISDREQVWKTGAGVESVESTAPAGPSSFHLRRRPEKVACPFPAGIVRFGDGGELSGNSLAAGR